MVSWMYNSTKDATTEMIPFLVSLDSSRLRVELGNKNEKGAKNTSLRMHFTGISDCADEDAAERLNTYTRNIQKRW